MESTRAFARKFWWLITIIVLIVLIGGAYGLGCRVGVGGLQRIGVLTLTELPAGTAVYVDTVLDTTLKKASDVKLELVPGHHTIIVGAPNEFPWSSLVSITSGQNVRLNPFLVSTKAPITSLTGDERTAALTAIASSTLPTPAKPLKLENGCANVYVSNNQVIEEAATSTPGCTPPSYLCIGGTCAPTIIFAPVAPVDYLFPFPGRQDAIVISFSGSLYALALDPTSPQFFAPLIRAANPKFGQLPDGTIVFEESSTVGKLSL